MLPFRGGSVREVENYKQRLRLMQEWGIVKQPDARAGQPAEVLDRAALDEFSFLYFTLWLYLSIWNRKNQTIRAAIVPAGPRGTSSLLVFSKIGTSFATPGRGAQRMTVVDDEYMVCPFDRNGSRPSDSVSKLCPVVNRIRYNLGIAPGDLATKATVPEKTEYCCDSAKAKLWEYISNTVVADPVSYWPVVGGTVFPVAIPFERLQRLLGDLTSTDSTEFGKLFEETLLWYAVPASGVMMGLPHVHFTKPHSFYEIDFLLYFEPQHVKPPDSDPPDGWARFAENDSLCVFELTVGHRPEDDLVALRGGDVDAEEEDAEDADEPGEDSETAGVGGEKASGNDHAKNKVFNFLALKQIGLKHVEAHYVSIVGPKGLNDVTRQVLGTVEGFSYTVVAGDNSIAQPVVRHFDQPVAPTLARSWHCNVVNYVVTTAEAFGRKVRGA